MAWNRGLTYSYWALDADLTPREQARIQRVSKAFKAICRDNLLWKTHCYEVLPQDVFLRSVSSLSGSQQSSRTRTSALHASTSFSAPSDTQAGSISSTANFSPSKSIRYLASQWDPSYEAEDVDWYSEYVARNAPISMHWLQTPSSGPGREGVPVKGLALMKDTSYDARDMAVLPLEDGTVCIWDLNRATRKTQRYMRGSMLNVSKPGLLFSRELKRPDKSILKTPVNDFVNAGDLVSVNSKDRKAYIAVGDTLNVLDIERLTVVARQPFPRLIFALSQETDYE
ncbi:hypothetical protein KEM55_005542, partial [Ascosphaera atra]